MFRNAASLFLNIKSSAKFKKSFLHGESPMGRYFYYQHSVKCPLIQALLQDGGHYWCKAGGRASIPSIPFRIYTMQSLFKQKSNNNSV